jgi:hypothetical protein
MGRLLLVPILVVVMSCIGIAYGAWSVLSHLRLRSDTRTQRNETISADINTQRHLAECYRDGCVEHRKSVILGCAWRLVIVEETHRAEDVEAATRDCSELDEKDRVAAQRTRDALLKQVQGTAKANL